MRPVNAIVRRSGLGPTQGRNILEARLFRGRGRSVLTRRYAQSCRVPLVTVLANCVLVRLDAGGSLQLPPGR